MTWSPETSCGFESRKIRSIAVPYLQGRAIDLGCGMEAVWPGVIGVDNGETFRGHMGFTIRAEIDNLDFLQDESCDAVFSSHALEDFDRERVPAVLTEWGRVLKPGGNLVLYVPSANFYPRCGEPGANPAHRWDIYPGDIEAVLRDMADNGGSGWEIIESEERGGGNEYSLFIVARKTAGGYSERTWERNPGGRKRALLIRYGAIGDQFVAASVVPGLKKQGYHVTYNTTPDAANLVRNDPHIDEFLIQERDFVPNQMLGEYWQEIAHRYDKVVNLCESIEGALLQLPGRLTHGYSDEARRRLYSGVNYWERTHDIADVPYDFNARFYPDEDELAWACMERNKNRKVPVVAWALAGSSIHKIWPYTQVVVDWLLKHTNTSIYLLGDAKEGKQLQGAILEMIGDHGGRVHPMAGEWEIRKVLTFCRFADVVVGPETGVLNSVALERVAKVIYLSHSSHENLTKHWINTEVLVPLQSEVPCYPCHRLHYDTTYCPRSEKTMAAECASNIIPERVFAAIAAAVGARREAA
jgi:ADP-heptose:LPS heptosyltransferase/predicted SAM-dependent methyltransferase